MPKTLGREHDQVISITDSSAALICVGKEAIFSDVDYRESLRLDFVLICKAEEEEGLLSRMMWARDLSRGVSFSASFGRVMPLE